MDAMGNWSVELTAGGQTLAEIKSKEVSSKETYSRDCVHYNNEAIQLHTNA